MDYYTPKLFEIAYCRGYMPVKHVPIQNRLNQEQEKMMQSRGMVNEMYEAADSITQYTGLQQTLFLINKVHSKRMIKSIV